MMNTNNTLCCHWCGVSLAGAVKVVYLNGNLPVCDLCLMNAKSVEVNRPKYENNKVWDFTLVPPSISSVDLDPEFGKLINEHFWELV